MFSHPSFTILSVVIHHQSTSIPDPRGLPRYDLVPFIITHTYVCAFLLPLLFHALIDLMPFLLARRAAFKNGTFSLELLPVCHLLVIDHGRNLAFLRLAGHSLSRRIGGRTFDASSGCGGDPGVSRQHFFPASSLTPFFFFCCP
jgi:hypothetical protein